MGYPREYPIQPPTNVPATETNMDGGSVMDPPAAQMTVVDGGEP